VHKLVLFLPTNKMRLFYNLLCVGLFYFVGSVLPLSAWQMYLRYPHWLVQRCVCVDYSLTRIPVHSCA